MFLAYKWSRFVLIAAGYRGLKECYSSPLAVNEVMFSDTPALLERDVVGSLLGTCFNSEHKFLKAQWVDVAPW